MWQITICFRFFEVDNVILTIYINYQFNWTSYTYKYQACECKGDNQERVSKYILKGKHRDGDGNVDDKDHLDLEDDAARHELNWPWRMLRGQKNLDSQVHAFISTSKTTRDGVTLLYGHPTCTMVQITVAMHIDLV